MQSINRLFVGRLKITRIIFICLLFLDSIRTTKIGIGENRDFHKGLKTCLSTLIEALYPDCTTLHLVIPMEPAWEADALISHFSDSSRMYAINTCTMGQSGYEAPPSDHVGCYLVNTEADLKMALKHLPQTKSKRSYVVLVNFYFGRHLGSYLQRTIPVAWKVGSARRVLFATWIEGNVQVFGTPLRGPGTSSVNSFRRLSVCDSNGPIKGPQPLSKLIESQESNRKVTLTVAMGPPTLPYVDRQTDDPGGIIGQYMKIVECVRNFTTKYVWSVVADDFPKFVQADNQRLAFNLYANPKEASGDWSTFLSTDGVWIIVIPDPLDRRNIFAMPFKNSIILHVVVLAIYTTVMVYFSRDVDKIIIMLRLLGMFFGVGVGWQPREALYRFLVILWCFSTYVLVQAYLATLTSELSIPIAHKSFHDAEDLIKSGIDILCPEATKDFYCDRETSTNLHICEECAIPEDNWSLQQYFHDQLRSTKTWNPFAFPVESLIFRSHPPSKSVTVMHETIGLWPGIMYSNSDAELNVIIKNTSERLFEAGIFGYWLNQYTQNNFTIDEFDHEILNMHNLNGVFIVLYAGWSCSIVVALIELLIKRYRSK